MSDLLFAANVYPNTAGLNLGSNTNPWNMVANLISINTLEANGTFGTVGQVLTVGSPGTNNYWAPTGNINSLAANILTANVLTVVNNAYINIESVAVSNINSLTVNTETVNTSTITTLNANTININGAVVNSTIYTGSSYNANNAAYLGGQIAANFVNTAQLAANIANVIPVSLATSIPTTGISNGDLWWDDIGGELYVYYSNAWVAAINLTNSPTSVVIGGASQIAFNNAGTESGDANLIWTTGTATLAVNGAITSNTLNSNTMTANNLTVNKTITANAVNSNYSVANGSLGLTGQLLASGGASANDYWMTPNYGFTGFRNKVMNGDMRIDQRNSGASGTAAGYTIDRWAYYASQASKLTWGRNLNAIAGPPGFPYYLGFQSSSAYSSLSTDYFFFHQTIEADAISDIQWGTSNGQTVTLSFWVYSSLTGTFSGCISNSGETRNYPFNYSIPVANTWTYITLQIPPDTTGTWVMSGNTGALYVVFDLGSGTTYRGTAGAWTNTLVYGASGSVSVVGTSGATFYMTGVQFEVGTIATPFERLSLTQSLANCQRYFQKHGGVAYADILIQGYITSSGSISMTIGLPVAMRAAPTAAVVGSWTISNVNSPNLYPGTTMLGVQCIGTVVGQGQCYTINSTTYITLSADI